MEENKQDGSPQEETQQFPPPTTPPQQPVFSQAPMPQQNVPKEPFYKKTWFVVLLLILFPPAGIPLAWVFKKPDNKTTRIVLTVVSALIVVYAIAPKSTTATPKQEINNIAQEQPAKKEEPKEEVKPKVTLESITAVYSGSVEDGTAVGAKATGFIVTGLYSDGSKKQIKDFKVENPVPLVSGQTSTYSISSNGKTCSVDIACPVKVPTEYKNALTKAQSYSDKMYMSKQGLYDQLTSEYGEKFTAEAAQYAIDNVKADWNANALKKAKQYFERMSMSPSAVYDQLVSEYGEKFTAEEAQYAVDNL